MRRSITLMKRAVALLSVSPLAFINLPMLASAQLAPAWLVIVYGTPTGDAIAVIPMPSIDFCETQGASWTGAKKPYRSSRTTFTCIEGQ